jgi:predicted aspartyl protease
MSNRGARRGRARPAAAAWLVVLLAAACTVVVPEEEQTAPPEFEEAPAEEPADPDSAELEVELVIAEGPGDSTLAFVPVFIDDEGPFRFALDTGASDTAVHLPLAEDLGLEMPESWEDLTDPQYEGFETGRVAICDRFPGESFYVAVFYHEWYITF